MQPAASAGATLRVIIAAGKFHGVIAATTPTGWRSTRMRLSAWWPRDHVAVDALGLFREPLDERRRVGDLALRLGERLALLGGHEHREVGRVQQDQVVPAAQQDRPLLGGLRGPGREGRVRGGDGVLRLRGAERGHRAELAAGRRDCCTGSVAPPAASSQAPFT